jgi:hypothetical protein
MRHVTATAVRFEGDEDGWHMLIDTDDELIDVHIHGIAWETFQGCDRTIGSEYRYAMSIKQEVAASRGDDDPDGGYDRNDPKHPAYHSTHADIWDQREPG